MEVEAGGVRLRGFSVFLLCSDGWMVSHAFFFASGFSSSSRVIEPPLGLVPSRLVVTTPLHFFSSCGVIALISQTRSRYDLDRGLEKETVFLCKALL